jgi:hypothetical protein
MRHISGEAAPSWRHRNYRLNDKKFKISWDNTFAICTGWNYSVSRLISSTISDLCQTRNILVPGEVTDDGLGTETLRHRASLCMYVQISFSTYTGIHPSNLSTYLPTYKTISHTHMITLYDGMFLFPASCHSTYCSIQPRAAEAQQESHPARRTAANLCARLNMHTLTVQT